MYRDESLAAATMAESLIVTLWWTSYRSLRPRRIAIVSSIEGSLDVNRLEPAFERGVLLDVLAILVERGRADAPELAAGQGGLEQVGGVHRALGLARADDEVQLVDEENHPALRLRRRRGGRP